MNVNRQQLAKCNKNQFAEWAVVRQMLPVRAILDETTRGLIAHAGKINVHPVEILVKTVILYKNVFSIGKSVIYNNGNKI